MSAFDAPNYGTQPEHEAAPWPADVAETARREAAEVVGRYPQKRSALLPLLHYVQSIDGYVSTNGIELCAEMCEVTAAEVAGVATFYTQYKRHPNGEYLVGVCTNTLCAVMGGDQIWDELSAHLGVGHDETTPDGKITLERLECNAACDFAPVVMANWEFFDNMTPESTKTLVDALRSGQDVVPTRGPAKLHTFKEVSRVLAGFLDGHADEGVAAGPATLLGLHQAENEGWRNDGSSAQQGSGSAGAQGDVAPATGTEGSSAQNPGHLATGEDNSESKTGEAK